MGGGGRAIRAMPIHDDEAVMNGAPGSCADGERLRVVSGWVVRLGCGLDRRMDQVVVETLVGVSSSMVR